MSRARLSTAALLAVAPFASLAACTSDTGGLWAPVAVTSSSGGIPDGGVIPPGSDGGGADAGSTAIPPCSELAGVPAVGTWTSVPVPADIAALLKSPPSITLVASPGEIYFVGSWEASRYVVHFSAASSSFHSIAIGSTAPTNRTNMITGIVNGKLYLFGGAPQGSTTPYTDGAVLDLASETWAALPTANAPALQPMQNVPPSPHVFLFGGRVTFFAPEDKPALAFYDPQSNAWTGTADPPPRIYDCESAAAGAPGVACAGLGAIQANVVSASSPQPTFTQLPDEGASSTSFVYPAFAGNDLVLWSFDPNVTASNAYRITVGSPSWTTIGQKLLPRAEPNVASVAGRVVVWGGAVRLLPRGDGIAYDPASNAWSPLACNASLASGSSGFASDDTRVYVLKRDGSALHILTL